MLTLIAALLIGLAAPIVLALDPSKALSQYAHDHWDTTDGMPEDVILAMAQTSDGYLWLGMHDGLVRFDGVRFQTFNRATTPELRSNWIRALCTAPDGALWIGTIDGLLRMHEGRVTAYGEGDGLRLTHVIKLTCAPDATVWIGTRGGGLFHTQGETIRQAEGWAGVETSVTAVLPLGDGTVLAGTYGDGIFRCTKGACQPEVLSPELTDRQVTALYQDRSGSVWAGFQSGAVGRLSGAAWTAHALDGASNNGGVRAITEDQSGSLWFGFLGGRLGRFREPGIRDEAAFLPKESLRVMSLLEDAEGSLWIGTNVGGLHRLKDGRVTSLGRFEGLPSSVTTSVFEDRAGTLWAGTIESGLIAIRNGRVQTYAAAAGLTSNEVYSIAQDTQGRILAATNKGVVVLIGDKFRALRKSGSKADGLVVALFTDSNGRVWVGGPNAGLAFVRDLELTTLGPAEGFPGGTAYTFAEGPDGRVWIGTLERGLYIYDGTAFRQISTESGLAVPSVQAIYVDAANVGWVATQGGGLHRIEDQGVAAVPTNGWLPTDDFYSVSEDGAGHLLLSSSKGILRVAKTDLQSVAAGRTTRTAFDLIGTDDGMRSADCFGGTQPAVWKDRAGRVWFPTAEGLVRLDEQSVPKNTRAPAVLVETVVADGQLVDLTQSTQFGPETRRIDIDYTATSLLAPSRVRFKYRLDGLDEDWVEAADRRSTTLTGLPSGHYNFRVIASNNDGVWNTEGASYQFSIRPPFYRTPFFYAAIALAALAAFWGFYQLRVAWLRARAGVLEERQRIASEIHDSLAQGLSGIAIQIEAALGRLRRAPDLAEENLRSAKDLAKSSLDEARRSVWNLRSPLLDEGSLLEALSVSAHQLAAGRVDEIKAHASGTPFLIDPEAENQLVRIAHEAISNAIHHGEASKITIEIIYAADQLALDIVDNGRGFDANTREHVPGRGFGVGSMERRASGLGGKLVIKSEPGAGTRVSVTIPRKSSLIERWRRLSTSAFRK